MRPPDRTRTRTQTTSMITATIITATTTTTIPTITTARRLATTMIIPIIIMATGIVMDRRKSTSPGSCAPAATGAPADEDLVITPAALYRLMTWLSPSFPVGAFSYSSGIEWAVEAGDICDAQSLRIWLSAMLSDGSGFCDGVLLCHAWRASMQQDDSALIETAELAAAFTPSRERHLETTAQGRAFADIADAAWSCTTLQRLLAIWPGAIAYPVAVGVVAAGHGVPLEPALQAFLHAQTANWISAGVRLIPLGQTDSQRVLAALEPTVAAVARRAKLATLNDLSSATFRADLASLHHETQYTRLFRS